MTKEIKNYQVYLTNPDKILFKKHQVSKKMLAEYYLKIQDWILPYIINRPLTILRCPDGVGKPCFFQKHPNESIPKEVSYIDFKIEGNSKPYLYIKDVDGLIALVQLGALEIHIWNHTINKLSHPDQLVLDLDPDEKFSFSQIAEGAMIINHFLQSIHLKTFLKTTGRRGLNIIIPLAQKNKQNEVLEFSEVFAKMMSTKYPKLFVATMKKSARKNRIFIDYIRNAQAATFIAPYSTRATENIGIATPISWKELSSINSGDHYNFSNAIARLSKLKLDPWKNFFKIRQSINQKNLQAVIEGVKSRLGT